MAEQFYTILTNTGKAKISNSILTGTKVNLTTLKVGDSNGAYYNPSETQTNLVHTVYQCNVTSVQVDTNNPNWITIISVIPSDQGGFFIREAGVFDDGGNLIAVGKYPETYKPQASDGSVKELYIKMTLEVSNATSVELKIDPTVILATKNDVNILTNTVNSIKSEVETARGGEANLDARLDKFNASLSEKANQSDLLAIENTPRAQYTRSATLNIATGAWVTIPWESKITDTNYFVSQTDNTKIIAKKSGFYLINLAVSFNNAAIDGFRNLLIIKNGVDSIAYDSRTAINVSTRCNLSTMVYLNTNEYIECRCLQSSSATLILEAGYGFPKISIVRLGAYV